MKKTYQIRRSGDNTTITVGKNVYTTVPVQNQQLIRIKTSKEKQENPQSVKRNRSFATNESPIITSKKFVPSNNRQGISIQPVSSALRSGIKIESDDGEGITECRPAVTTNLRYSTYTSPIAMSTPLNSPILPIASSTSSTQRPTIYITKKTSLKALTFESIEKFPILHLGVTEDRLLLLKNVVCPAADITVCDLYMTLKKLRLNEDFHILSEYFEYKIKEDDYNKDDKDNIINLDTTLVIEKFCQTITKLAKYLKFLIKWPISSKYYDRHKNIPIVYRPKLSCVQSLVECVEIEVQPPSLLQMESYFRKTKNSDLMSVVKYLKSYKFVFSMTLNGVITFVSSACVGKFDDITIFNACNFLNSVPKYLTLVADPGIAIKRKTNESENNKQIKEENIDKSKIANYKKLSLINNSGNIKQCEKSDSDDNITDDDNNNPSIMIKKEHKNSIDFDNLDDYDEVDEKEMEAEYETCTIYEELVDEETGKKSLRKVKVVKIPDRNSIKSLLNSNKKTELSSNCTLNVSNNKLISKNAKNVEVPTVRVHDDVCKLQILSTICEMKAFKILQSHNALEPQLYNYLNEIIIVISALINLQS